MKVDKQELLFLSFGVFIMLVIFVPFSFYLTTIGKAAHVLQMINQTTFEDELKISTNTATSYDWSPDYSILIKGIAVSGSASGAGNAKIFLSDGNEKYLIADITPKNSVVYFTQLCNETCSLYGLYSPKYSLVFETENGVNINANTLTYSAENIENGASSESSAEVQTATTVLKKKLEFPSSGAAIGALSIQQEQQQQALPLAISIASTSGRNTDTDDLTATITTDDAASKYYEGIWYKNGEPYTREYWSSSQNRYYHLNDFFLGKSKVYFLSSQYPYALASSFNLDGTNEMPRQFSLIRKDSSDMITGKINISQMAVDNEENIYVTGKIAHLSQYGTYIDLSNTNAWLLKQSPAPGWEREFSLPEKFTSAKAIDTDEEGNIYLAGYAEDGYDRNSGIQYANVLVLKYSPQGDLLWSYIFGNRESSETGTAIKVGKTGIYVGANNKTFSTTSTDSTALVLKLDFNGNLLWNTNLDRSLNYIGTEPQPFYLTSLELGQDEKVYIRGASGPSQYTFQYSAQVFRLENENTANTFFSLVHDSRPNGLQPGYYGESMIIDNLGQLYLANGTHAGRYFENRQQPANSYDILDYASPGKSFAVDNNHNIYSLNPEYEITKQKGEFFYPATIGAPVIADTLENRFTSLGDTWKACARTVSSWQSESQEVCSETITIAEADISPPEVSLNAPANNSETFKADNTFACTASDSSGLKNMELSILDENSNVISSQIIETTALSKRAEFGFDFTASGKYFWGCRACDKYSNCAWTPANYTIAHIIDSTPPAVVLSLPADKSSFTSPSQTFSCSAEDNIGATSISLNIWKQNANISAFMSNTAQYSRAYTIPYNGNFKWNCYSCDKVKNCAWAPENFSFEYTAPDTTPPMPKFIEPTPANYAKIESGDINISVENALDLGEFSFTFAGNSYTPFDSSLRLMASFDEAYPADNSPYKNNGAIGSNVVSGASGKYQNAYQFGQQQQTSGSDPGMGMPGMGMPGMATVSNPNAVEFPAGQNLNFGGSQITVSAWVNPSEANNGKAIAAQRENCQQGNWQFIASIDGGLYFNVWKPDGTNNECRSGTPLTQNQWSLAGAAYNGAEITIYINGIPVKRCAGTGQISTNQVKTYFGIDSCGNTFKGLIDEPRIYSRALNDAEMKKAYSSHFTRKSADQWNFFYPAKNLADGSYSYKATAADNRSNTASTEERVLVFDAFTDASRPSVFLVSPSTTKTTESSIEFSCSIKDNVQTSNLSLTLTDSYGILSNSTISFQANESTASWTGELPYEGTFYWGCYGCDNSSNCMRTASQQIRYDGTAPVIKNEAITIPESEFFSFDYNASDASGISCFSINDTKFRIDCSGMISSETPLYPGEYSLNITATDNFGNAKSAKFTLNSLALPPIITLIAPEYSNTNKNAHTFSCSADDITRVESITLRLWNSENSQVFSDTISTYSKYELLSLEKTLPYDDEFKWNCFACDTSGNCRMADKNRTLYYESTPPEIFFVNNTPKNESTLKTNTLRINVSLSENAVCMLYLDNGELGSGKKGKLVVNTADTIINDYAYMTINSPAGNNIIYADTAGFEAGDEIMIIQMQNYIVPESVGTYEFAHIAYVNLSSKKIILFENLNYSYYSGKPNQEKAIASQIVKVPHYESVFVLEKSSITAPKWDGYKGGIIVFRATNDTALYSVYEGVMKFGSINATGKGYRGYSHTDGGYFNAGGFQGESITGLGIASRTSSSNAGGGGEGKQDAAGGGGGSYATAGKEGEFNPRYAVHYGGLPATIILGEPSLQKLFFGGAGGEGGADEDGGKPGGGDSGGGIIKFFSKKVTLNQAEIISEGGAGEPAQQKNGCGTGGGGGGAGGSVYISAKSFNLFSGAVHIRGSIGGIGAAGPGYSVCGGGGAPGGEGRVRVDAQNLLNSRVPYGAYTDTFAYAFASGYMLNTSTNGTHYWANTTVYNLELGNHEYFVKCVDTSGNIGNSENRTVTALINTTPPKIEIISPAQTTYDNSLILFNISSSDQLSDCLYSLDNFATLASMTVLNETSFYSFLILPSGDYIAHFWCNDTAGNINSTELASFQVRTKPKINATLFMPHTEIPRNTFFNISINVSCIEGICGTIKTLLDPETDLFSEHLISYWSMDQGNAEGMAEDYKGTNSIANSVFAPGLNNESIFISSDTKTGSFEAGNAESIAVSLWAYFDYTTFEGSSSSLEGTALIKSDLFALKRYSDGTRSGYCEINVMQSNGVIATAPAISCSAGNWHNIIFIADSSKLRFYVDGTETTTEYDGTFYPGNNPIFFGSETESSYTPGRIDETGIWINIPFDGETAQNFVNALYNDGNGAFFTKPAPEKGAVSTTTGAKPFYTITQNPFTTLTNERNTEKITFEINATGDAGSFYDFFATAVSEYDSEAKTKKTRATIVNTPPVQSQPILNSTTGKNFTSENLTCYSHLTFDANGDAVTNIIKWNENGTEKPELENLSKITSGNLSAGANWTCSITPFDGTDYGAVNYSANLTILCHDRDSDGICDESDNCIDIQNPLQEDCNGDGKGDICDIINPLVVESCDGLDNDCDGVVDDGLAAPAGDKLLGVCAGSVKFCGGVGGWLEPDYSLIDGYSVVESCDGLDNDCDGVVDEMTASDVNNCGSCGAVCDLAKVNEHSCSNGICGIITCDAGWANADKNDLNGCEHKCLPNDALEECDSEDITAPVISISSEKIFFNTLGAISLNVNVNELSHVEIYAGDTLSGAVDIEESGTVMLTPSQWGALTVRAAATDTSGNSGESNNLELIFDNTPPVFSNMTPAENSPVKEGANQFSVLVTDDYGVDFSSFKAFIDGIEVNTESEENENGAKILFAYGLTAGLHTIRADAQDLAGNTNYAEWQALGQTQKIEPPIITDITAFPESPVYSPGASYGFSARISSEHLTEVWYYWNNVSETDVFPSETHSFAKNNLPAGTYIYSWCASDSAQNTVCSENITYTVEKAQSSTALYLNSNSGTYGDLIRVSCTLYSGDCALNMLRNGSSIMEENDTGILLSAGSYLYNCTCAESENYLSNWSAGTYTVKKATPVLAIETTPAEPTTGSEVRTTGNGCPEETTCTLFRNRIAVENPDIFVPDETFYVYEFVSQPSTNYEEGRAGINVRVNAGSPQLPMLYNYSDNTMTLLGRGTAVFNVYANNTNGTVLLNLNGTIISPANPESNHYSASAELEDGVYEYKWTAYGADTYAESQTFTYEVLPATADITAPTAVFNYPPNNSNVSQGFNLSCSAEDDIMLSSFALAATNSSGFTQVLLNLTDEKPYLDINVSIIQSEKDVLNLSCTACDKSNNCARTENRIFSYSPAENGILPAMELKLITPQKFVNVTQNGTVYFSANLSCLNADCGFIHAGIIQEINVSENFTIDSENFAILSEYILFLLENESAIIGANITFDGNEVDLFTEKKLNEIWAPEGFNGEIGDSTNLYFAAFLSSATSIVKTYSEIVNVTITGSERDIVPPEVKALSPENNYVSEDAGQAFSCSITDDIEIKNLTVYVWNSTKYNVQKNYSDVSDASRKTAELSWRYENLAPDNYTWQCFGCDKSSNCIYSESRNYTFFDYSAHPAIGINISLIEPEENITTAPNSIFKITVNISCEGGACGNTAISLLDDEEKPVSIDPEDEIFANSSNPSSLIIKHSALVDYYINTTGNIGAEYTVFVRAESNTLSADSRAIKIRLANMNHAPKLISQIPDVELAVGDTATINISGYFKDDDGDELLYSGKAFGAFNLALNEETGEASVTATSEGERYAVFTASDGALNAESNKIKIAFTGAGIIDEQENKTEECTEDSCETAEKNQTQEPEYKEEMPPALSGSRSPSCSDQIKNQDETGIDCGGICPACEEQLSAGKTSALSLSKKYWWLILGILLLLLIPLILFLFHNSHKKNEELPALPVKAIPQKPMQTAQPIILPKTEKEEKEDERFRRLREMLDLNEIDKATFEKLARITSHCTHFERKENLYDSRSRLKSFIKKPGATAR
jgi:methionine-rich copper-binding protein CopC